MLLVRSLERISRASGLPSWIGWMMTNMRVSVKIRPLIVKSSPQNISIQATSYSSKFRRNSPPIKTIKGNPPFLNENTLQCLPLFHNRRWRIPLINAHPTPFWQVWWRAVGKTSRTISTRRRSGSQSSPGSPCSRLTFNLKTLLAAPKSYAVG